jgi:hypothetical protein
VQIDELRKAPKARLITVGSVTGNDNTVGGGGVYPVADLRELDGLKNGAREVSDGALVGQMAQKLVHVAS